MKWPILVPSLAFLSMAFCETNDTQILAIDLTKSINLRDVFHYYSTLYKKEKICVLCGIRALGTAMHFDENPPGLSDSGIYPALIPSSYLVTKLIVLDFSANAKQNSTLSLEDALESNYLQEDPKEPTLLLFKFGVKVEPYIPNDCTCYIPGISLNLAAYIASNLSHVVGVATDAPTLESNESRRGSISVSQILGSNAVYTIDNVNAKENLPTTGCMAIAMPTNFEEENYVPCRLIAFCPRVPGRFSSGKQVVLGLDSVDKHLPWFSPKSNLDTEPFQKKNN